MQSVSVKELSRKGVSDAEGAVTKVTGISKQDGVKNVFVRGLGDRYNTTTFNGFPVPSEDRNTRISLLIFRNRPYTVRRSQQSIYCRERRRCRGANIDISSKELVGDGYISASVSAGVNTQTLSSISSNRME